MGRRGLGRTPHSAQATHSVSLPQLVGGPHRATRARLLGSGSLSAPLLLPKLMGPGWVHSSRTEHKPIPGASFYLAHTPPQPPTYEGLLPSCSPPHPTSGETHGASSPALEPDGRVRWPGRGPVSFPLSLPWHLFRFPPEPTGLTKITTCLLRAPPGSPAAARGSSLLHPPRPSSGAHGRPPPPTHGEAITHGQNRG